MDNLLDRAIVAQVPVLIKARPTEASGRRIVEVESSTEQRDYDGDVVLQDALLGSADSFIANGHLDIDHLSEFGSRLGIPDPSSYIVGRPLSVKSMPGERTFVEGEISRSLDGVVNIVRNRYDEFWASLQRDPPVQWFASIYGFPLDLDDATSNPDFLAAKGATRWVIKAIDWRSLAFTRSPKNTALKSAARIITAKSYLSELLKSCHVPVLLPSGMPEVLAKSQCTACDVQAIPSLLGYRQHFMKCCGYPAESADLFAHATMYRTKLAAYLQPSFGIG